MLRLEKHNDHQKIRGVVQDMEMMGHNCVIVVVDNIHTLKIHSHNNVIKGHESW